MKESGHDIFDIEDPLYQDICTPFDSEDGTDMLLSDRINFIFTNEDTKCQSNCKISFYSLESQYLNCSCSANEKHNNEIKNKIEEFSTKKLYESFYDVLKYSNYGIIKCFNVFDLKNLFTKNIGNIIIVLFFIIYLICLIIYIIKGINPLKIRLINNIEKSNEEDNINIKKNFKFLFYPPHKHNKKLKHKIKSKQNTSRTIEINSDVIKNKRKINKKKIKTQINKRKM